MNFEPHQGIKVFEGVSESLVSNSNESSSTIQIDESLVKKGKKRVALKKAKKSQDLPAGSGKKMEEPRAAVSNSLKKDSRRLPQPKTKGIQKGHKRVDQDGNKVFMCQLCLDKKIFHKAEALGGHMSKSHKNMSRVYAEKKQKRIEREPFRRLLMFSK